MDAVIELWTALPVVIQIMIKIVTIMLPLMISWSPITPTPSAKSSDTCRCAWDRNRVGFFGMRLWAWSADRRCGQALMFKEIVVPNGANKLLFLIAPMLSIGPALAAWRCSHSMPGWSWPTSTPVCCTSWQ